MRELFLIIKPLRFFHYYDEFVGTIRTFDLNLLLVSAFIYACGLASRASLCLLRKIAWVLQVLFFCSMIPSIAIYAAPHVSADTATVLTTNLLFLTAFVLQALVQWLKSTGCEEH